MDKDQIVNILKGLGKDLIRQENLDPETTVIYRPVKIGTGARETFSFYEEDADEFCRHMMDEYGEENYKTYSYPFNGMPRMKAIYNALLLLAQTED